ncbi:MAG TPA: hypothetical protein VG986_14720 [Pseudolabrys sp.]|nr:hypothetical protein [Pseudolabrys sp.]
MLISVLLTVQGASAAADWSYCVAPSNAHHRIYISTPFPAVGPRAESEFDQTLVSRQLAHDAVQCARADDESQAVMGREYAVEVNRRWGRQVVDLNWRPSQ